MPVSFLDLIRYVSNSLHHISGWRVFWATLVFVLGWIVSIVTIKKTMIFSDKIHLNQLFKRMAWNEILSKIDCRLSISRLLVEVVRWSIIIISLMFSLKILNLSYLGSLLWRLIVYLPNIYIAILIFIVAVFLADLSQKVMVGTLKRERITYSRFLGRFIRWVIWFLAGVAILYQLKIASELMLIIFIGVVIAISVSLAISFGLGGKDIVARLLKELEDRFK